jgi:hypothetical protein
VLSGSQWLDFNEGTCRCAWPIGHLSATSERGRNLTAGPSIIDVIGDLLTNIGEFEIFTFGQRLLGRESEVAIFDCFFSQIIRVVHGTPPISERSYGKVQSCGGRETVKRLKCIRALLSTPAPSPAIDI